MYLLIECVVLITFNVLLCSSTPSNAWLTMSSTNLPSTPLFGFAVGIYNRTLHIVGGSSSPQSSPLSTTVYSNSIYPYNITNYTLIDFNSDDGSSSWQSIPDVVDPRFELGFKCKGQCYSAHREYLYIVNPESLFFDETGYLVIYNMATSTFIAPSTFNGSLIFPEAGSCATNNGSHLFAIGRLPILHHIQYTVLCSHSLSPFSGIGKRHGMCKDVNCQSACAECAGVLLYHPADYTFDHFVSLCLALPCSVLLCLTLW